MTSKQLQSVERRHRVVQTFFGQRDQLLPGKEFLGRGGISAAENGFHVLHDVLPTFADFDVRQHQFRFVGVFPGFTHGRLPARGTGGSGRVTFNIVVVVVTAAIAVVIVVIAAAVVVIGAAGRSRKEPFGKGEALVEYGYRAPHFVLEWARLALADESLGLVVQLFHLHQFLVVLEVDQQEARGSVLEQADATLLLNDVHGGHHIVGQLVVLAGIGIGGLVHRSLRRERRGERKEKKKKREKRKERPVEKISRSRIIATYMYG